ncbi:MAG: Ldh family oxidoreductase [Chloroflexi bacterium]|nr:Ldh family oxidoreductase [Chloroflexota bacterium]
MPTFTALQLIDLTARLFEAAGAPPAVARQVGASLVEANLTGHESHGVIRAVQYVRAIERGQINPRAELEVLRETPTTALLDAHWGFGQIAARRGMELAIAKARQHHLAAVGLRNSAHIGRLGEYVLMAAEQGLIGFMTCNSSLLVAPHGGVDRVFGTNPVAFAIPGGRQPFLTDFATSACAEGKLRVAQARDRSVPAGWILDRDRRPTTNPSDFYDGGVILPLGGHKGYGLLLMADLLGGALTGHGCTALPEHTSGNGVFMMAIDVEAFCPLAELASAIDRLFEHIKAGNRAPDCEEILIPGEPEMRSKAQRERDGIELPETTWRELVEAARQFGLREGLDHAAMT